MDLSVVLTLLIMWMLVLAPPAMVWVTLSRFVSGPRSWVRPALALIAPPICAFIALTLLWLAGFEGRCGGWLGETSACGFAQYAGETMHMTLLTLAMPSLFGIALGVGVMVFCFIRCGRASSSP